MANVPIPRAKMRDPVGLKYWPLPVGRDGERTPIPWSDGLHAGFTTGEPWLPVDTGHETYASASADPHSVLSFTRRLIHLRAQHPALHEGGMEFLSTQSPRILSFRRFTAEESLSVSINFARIPTVVRGSAAAGKPDTLFSSVEQVNASAFAPWEVRICRQ